MSHIDDLIKKACPNGVEFKTLGELGYFFGGLTGKSKADFAGGNARFISYVNIFNNINVNTNADDFVRVSPNERQRALQYRDILFTGSSETPNEVGMSSVVTTEVREPLYLNSFSIGYRLNDPNTFEPNFMKHLFRSNVMRKQIIGTASGVTRFNVSKARFAKVSIPIPPLEVQHEIAKILDLLNKLEAELEAELEGRRAQYAYYRDQLLTSPVEGRWVSLSDILEMRAGDPILATEIAPDLGNGHPFPCYGGGGLRGFVGKSNREGEYVLIGRQGALCGNVTRASGRFFSTEHSIAASVKKDADVAWAFHALEAMNLNQYASKSAQPGLNVGNILKLRVEIPPFEEQRRFGVILDMFDVLFSDLSIGIPAELAARRKQYGYYRDRLMTFEESVA